MHHSANFDSNLNPPRVDLGQRICGRWAHSGWTIGR